MVRYCYAVELKTNRKDQIRTVYKCVYTYLIDMLESVNDEALQRPRVQHFVVVNIQLVQRVDALNLAQQNKRVQEIVRKHELL